MCQSLIVFSVRQSPSPHHDMPRVTGIKTRLLRLILGCKDSLELILRCGVWWRRYGAKKNRVRRETAGVDSPEILRDDRQCIVGTQCDISWSSRSRQNGIKQPGQGGKRCSQTENCPPTWASPAW